MAASGALLGPLFGIIMADYWIIRRAHINVLDLYRTNPKGTYYFTRGVNYRAVTALALSSVIALLLAFLPALHVVGAFAWFLGSGAGALSYLLLAKRPAQLADIDGEAIAVTPKH